ncbi:MAG: Fe-S-containing hydro-lyase [Clostridiaceae bacterium]|nr:Fe-S-containing hydro-lyase [Clostridiaceae bacterium]
MTYKITAPLTRDIVDSLRAGDMVEISGTIYTARDAAHKRLMDIINAGGKLPFDLNEQVIYYVGPCPAPEGIVIGSAGPTTSGRMDCYTPKLIELGLSGMIGKGQRSTEVIDAMVRNGAVYFGAIGGAGALISKSIKSQQVIAFEDLGTEAVRKLTVVDFPAIVIIDRFGNNLYNIGRNRYADKS